MFEDLSDKFSNVIKNMQGKGKISEDNVKEAMREVKLALLGADVNVKVVKAFTKRVKERALGKDVVESISPGQQFTKIVHDELTELMGSAAREYKFHDNRMNVILLSGLQGAGKTTACSKLALHFRKTQKLKPLMVACDTYRPAAIDQLETLGKSLNIPVYSDRDKKPQDICADALKYAKKEDHSLVIIDTAGRLHVDENMMAELKEIVELSKPDEKFFVADAMTGQDAVAVADEFFKEIGFDGVILTKMDGDARGGSALSIREVTGVPVSFLGVGERPDALEIFHPERMASRILGMGDIVSLVEKAQQVMDAKESKKLEKKIKKNAFTLQDFLDQLQQIEKMGSIKDLLGMIPGLGSKLKDIDIDSETSGLKHVKAIIFSMTLKEREKPNIIDASRKRRIAKGCGRSVQEINRLLKQFGSMKDMMKRMNKISKKRGQGAALRNLLPF